MADTSILTAVKNALGITGEYQDPTISVYIDDVMSYMESAGVSTAVINSSKSAGVIARGVSDLWNYNGGAGKLSDYFYQRVGQLVYATAPPVSGSETTEPEATEPEPPEAESEEVTEDV